MSSLTASSSVADSFPGPMALAHSYNSRGELGAFVNPYGCSCVTCRDYVAERSAPTEPASPLAGPGTGAGSGFGQVALAPSLGPSPTPWVVGPSLQAARSPAVESSLIQPTALRSLGLGIGGLTAASVRAPLTFGMAMNSLGSAPALARTVTGLGYAPSVVPEADNESDAADAETPDAPGLRGVDPEEDAVMARLQSLRASLLVQQDAVYSTDGRSHDEMAAQDAEWEELDNKIHAIEALFMAFGVVFRTR